MLKPWPHLIVGSKPGYEWVVAKWLSVKFYDKKTISVSHHLRLDLRTPCLNPSLEVDGINAVVAKQARRLG